MIMILILTLLLSIFANRALCATTFLRPPEWNDAVDRKAGFGKNVRYTVGNATDILWETDLDKVELYLIQTIESTYWEYILDSSRTECKAEWDVSGILKENEDAVYYFALGEDPNGLTGPDGLMTSIASTQYFNVTAPRIETTIASTLQTSTTGRSMSSSHVATSATQLLPTSTAPDESSNSDADLNSDSLMSKGETAGAAVGGTIGGLILLGVVGWFIWRRLGRSKGNTDMSVVPQSQQGQVSYSETKAELPGDMALEVYPAGLTPPIMQLNWVFLLVSSLASLAACRDLEFVNPPRFDLLDDGFRNYGNNQRYKQGEIVDVILSDYGDMGDLAVWQLSTAGNKKGREIPLDVIKQSKITKTGNSRRFNWTAAYDIGHYLQNGEDAVYYFGIRENSHAKVTVRSAFFNVSMPDSGRPKSPVASKPSRKEKNRKGKNCKSCNSCQKCQNRKGKNPKEKNPKEKKASARSGLTGGQVAGITIGSIVTFALILCGFCWGFERMRVAKQLRKSQEFELRNMERDVRSLRETVAKLGA
ncbi:uncharacterized protein FTJAE_771 [Fusarium tjaetaba]|uniref:Mid2 domain-containing protein n=1 Tax=Fusarium tjaetaba TaxID=1567544 RepID=A0A8H5SFI8_9HYPO|nr:uncharacterized protein FTJAE_771 [Fusarium tjaetaba]KAF5649807.1 hypothetical protein FTJAE_771 [Fusarium tjaetaba]